MTDTNTQSTEQNQTTVSDKPLTEVTRNGVTLPILREERKGKNGNASSSYYTVDLAQLGTSSLITFFGTIKAVVAFLQPEFNRGMISTQLITPAQKDTELTDAQKTAKLAEYVAELESTERKRNGPKAELKALMKAQQDHMMIKVKAADWTAKLIEMATKIANLMEQIEKDTDNS